MVKKIPTQEQNVGAMQLQAMADRAQTRGELRNPIIEQALMKAAREQSQAAVETTEQAAGLTGAAQAGMAQLAQLAALGQASMQARAQRVQNMQASLQLQAQLQGQVASVEEQRYQTNLQHEQFMAQLEAQEKAQEGNMLANIAGGALAAFAGGPGLAALLGPAVDAGVDAITPTADMGLDPSKLRASPPSFDHSLLGDFSPEGLYLGGPEIGAGPGLPASARGLQGNRFLQSPSGSSFFPFPLG